MLRDGSFCVNLVFFSNFYVSLFPLWISVFIRYFFKTILNEKYYIYFVNKTFWHKVIFNYHFIFLLTVLVLFIICYIYLNRYINNYDFYMDEKKKFSKIRKHRTLTINFMLTYVLPIMAFDFWEIEGIVLFVLYFFVLSFLIVKNRIFDGNMILELNGFTFYDCIDKDTEHEYIIVYKGDLRKNKIYKLKFANQNDVAFAYDIA